MTTAELVAWHTQGRAAATVATIRDRRPACEECWQTHSATARKCPGCGACDWVPPRPCWNCEDDPRLAL